MITAKYQEECLVKKEEVYYRALIRIKQDEKLLRRTYVCTPQ